MGPGHSGAALAAKPLAPRVPLWILFAVSEGIDVLFLIFAFVGIERQSVTKTSLENGIEILTPGVILWSHGFFYVFNLVRICRPDNLYNHAKNKTSLRGRACLFQPLNS